jgi:hypothetical protein
VPINGRRVVLRAPVESLDQELQAQPAKGLRLVTKKTA